MLTISWFLQVSTLEIFKEADSFLNWRPNGHSFLTTVSFVNIRPFQYFKVRMLKFNNKGTKLWP